MTEKNNEKAEYTLPASTNSRSESAEKATSKPAAPKKDKTVSPRNRTQPKAKSGGVFTGLLVLVNLSFIGAAGYAGYEGWQYWQAHQTEQQAQFSQMKQANEQLKQQVSLQLNQATQRSEEAVKEELGAVQGKLLAQDQRIAEVFEQTQRLSGSQSSHWQISESAFLLRMAGRKLWFEKDAATAIQLLKLADQQLANITDSRLYPIRQKVSQDIAQLQAVNYASPTQKAIQLQALYTQVPQLSFIQPGKLQSTDEEIQQATAAGAWERTKLWLKDNIFEVTRHDKPIAPFISEQQQWLVVEQMKYQLLIAQNALFRNEAEIYSNALAQIQSNAEQFFVLDSAKGRAFMQQLSALQSHKFEGQFPEHLSAELALNAYIKQAALENAL